MNAECWSRDFRPHGSAIPLSNATSECLNPEFEECPRVGDDVGGSKRFLSQHLKAYRTAIPLLGEYGTRKTATAVFRPWLSGESP